MNKILILNENKAIVDFITKSLSHLDFKLNFSPRLTPALQYLKSEKPNIIFMSLVLEEKDGIEVCQKIRDSLKFNNVAIVFLSTVADNDLVIKTLNAGADDYILYPISEELFVRKINSILKRFVPKKQED